MAKPTSHVFIDFDCLAERLFSTTLAFRWQLCLVGSAVADKYSLWRDTWSGRNIRCSSIASLVPRTVQLIDKGVCNPGTLFWRFEKSCRTVQTFVSLALYAGDFDPIIKPMLAILCQYLLKLSS
jgi:hypothetical protein